MIIIHGDDTTASRDFLNQQITGLKKQNLEIVRLESDFLSPATLEQNLNSQGLFGSDKAVVVFSFFKLTNSKNKDQLKQVFIKNQTKNIILYEDKQVNANILKAFDKVQVRLFKTNPIIFKFLESIKPNNQRQIIIFLRQLEEAKEAPELIFAMLVRQIRLLLTAKDASGELKMASWQKQRLVGQAGAFSLKKIMSLHTKLYEIDKSIKTGKTGLELKDLLFNLLIRI